MTINEKQRRADFRCMVKPYTFGISKIERARQKYGWQSFQYDVLDQLTNENKEVLLDQLCTLEKYYIQKYDTYNNGYNSTKGGEGFCRTRSVEENQKLSDTFKKRGIKPNELAHTLSAKASSKAVLQIDKNGNVVAEYSSIREASDATKANAQNISDICRGAIKIVNGKPYQRKTTGGYYWKFK